LDIINSSGIKVSSYSLKGISEIEINNKDYSNGIYFYNLYSIEGYMVSGKFVVK
jgi:hypothetical protein